MAFEVTYQDVVDRWPSETFPFRAEYINTLIADALAVLRVKVPGFDSVVDGVSDAARRLICQSIIGVLRNPEGFKSESDGGYSYEVYGDGSVWFRQTDIDAVFGSRSASWQWLL